MLTLPLGIILVVLVTFFSLDFSQSNIYLNFHSFVIVGLGTLAVFIFSNPLKNLKHTMAAFFDLFKRDTNSEKLKQVLLKLSENKKNIQSNDTSSFPLLGFAHELWEQGVDSNDFESLIIQKYNDINSIAEQPVHVLKSLSKYPPALGMTGTVMGMISLFSNLNSDNKSEIGQYLAVAMTATFYGLILANLVLLPIADRIAIKYQSSVSQNEVLLNALLKINKNEPVQLIENMNIEQNYIGQVG